jgi:hypothetical protein
LTDAKKIGMKKVYLVYYDFSGTSGNHAGMSHLVRILDKQLELVQPLKSFPHHYKGGQYLARLYAIGLAIYFRFVLRKGEMVFFFEYLTKGTAFQVLTAKMMRWLGIRNPVYALIHLSGKHMLDLYGSENYISASLRSVDRIFVLGSSLAVFLKNIGFQKEITTTFHYVDTDYYKPLENKPGAERLQVICIGSLKRNFALLQSLVAKMPDVVFHILMGRNNLRSYFEGAENVKLYPFIPEQEMLRLMQHCDVSMSVMEDTIGSNVITTSMAVGLVQVVSDVGSIRDYCSVENSFLCSKEEDYLKAIEQLKDNRNLLGQMRAATLRRAGELSHQVFVQHFKSFIWNSR